MIKRGFKVASVLLCLLLAGGTLSGCANKSSNSTLTKVSLNEVTRSVFYAPMYAAMALGYFKEQGIEIDLTTGEGADKTMQQVLSKNADIGFCGPEQTIYIYNQKRDDYPVLFAQGTQTDGAFIVGRTDDKSFTWATLKGKDIVGGRPGGIPEMALEYALKSHGLQPGKDVNVITNIAYAATTGAFKGGTGQYAALFEPNASLLRKDNSGYILASVGKSAGVIPETCYFTTKSFMTKNPEIIQKFTNALYKGQLWVNKNSNEKIAKVIQPYFVGTDLSIITNVIKNYKNINAYSTNPLLTESIMKKFMDIIQGYKASLIPARPPFSKIVNTSFAKNAINDIK